MIYLGNGRFLDVDKIVDKTVDKDYNLNDYNNLIYGDKIIDNNVVDSMIDIIPGVLITSGTIYGVVKKGKVLRLVSTENRYPNFKVVTSKTSKKFNSYCVIKKKEFKDGEHYAELLDIIPNIGDINTERRYLKTVFGINYKKLKFNPSVDIYKRERLNLYAYSIDPKNCHDIDDAIHIKLYDSITEIGVHIADVSSLIDVESDLDTIISKRGESVYLKNSQLDMLPESFIKELSLFEKIEKKCFSVIMTFKDTQLIKVDFKRCLIVVKNNLSYEEASKLKIPDIKNLYEFGKKIYDNNNNNDKENYDIHKTVEIFMVLANQQVAKKIKESSIFNPIFRKYSSNIVELNNNIDNKTKNIIKYFNSDKALYSLTDAHEDVGEYSHFTSPLRRYIDIVTHRMLWGSLIRQNIKVCKLPINQLIENINFRAMDIKKCSRDSIRLEESYKRCSNGKSLETKQGKIVKFGDNSITVYFDDEDFTVSCKIVPDDVVKTVIDKDTYIEIEIDKQKTVLSLGQTVKVNVIASFSSPKLSDKLTGQLVEPDIRSFFLLPNFS